MRRIKLLLSLLVCIAFTANVFAQETPFDDLPPTSEYGKCYAKCKVPDQYETVEKQIVKKPASTKLVKVPAVYDNKTETVLVKEGTTKYRTIPATYRTETVTLEVEPAKTIIKTIPAKFETKSRQVLETPARGQWIKKKKYPNCFSQNPDDCYVACYEEVPAKYRTETYQVLVREASTSETTIPAKTKTITKKVIDQPARVEEIPVEPVYKTVTTKVLVSPESTRTEDIPAVYSTVREKQLIKTGGYTVWTEILCAEKTTSSKVRSVQRKLNELGYNCGSPDGVMGIRTQAALKQYQTEKGLPIGNLNIETLKAMGLDY